MPHCCDKVVRGNGQMLDTGTFEIVQVFLYLGFSLSLSRLVNWKLDCAGGISHYLGSQRRVFSADVLVVEADELGEPEDLAIEFDPEIHLALFHVRYDVVNSP